MGVVVLGGRGGCVHYVSLLASVSMMAVLLIAVGCAGIDSHYYSCRCCLRVLQIELQSQRSRITRSR